jgi:hypothetical protein
LNPAISKSSLLSAGLLIVNVRVGLDLEAEITGYALVINLVIDIVLVSPPLSFTPVIFTNAEPLLLTLAFALTAKVCLPTAND